MDRLDVNPSPSRSCRFTRRHRLGGGEGSFFFPPAAWLRASAAGCLVLLLSCAKGDRLAGGTSETETGTATGQLVLKGGAAARGARVTLFAAGEDTGNSAADTRTLVTDSSGAYAFDSLAFATYNMTASYVPAGSQDTLVASRLRIEVAESDPDVEIGVDTLRGPGAVSARVLFLANPVEEAICYVPGTSYLALTDSGGRCLVSGIPPGRYRLSFKADGYLTARAPDTVRIATDDTVSLGDVGLQLDDRLAPPKPTGLAAAFDSSTGKVTLSWSRVPAGDLAGYALYRDAVAAVNFTRLTPDRLVSDTFFVDSLPGLKAGADTALAYRIKAQDRSGEQSGFALFDTVRVRLIRGNRAPTLPFAPRPLDSSAGAPLTVTLQWKSRDADGDPILADVHFGKLGLPPARIAHALEDSFLVVPTLDSLASYQWRVSVTDGRDTVLGPVWTFTTGTKPVEGWKRLGYALFQPTDMWFIDRHRGWIAGPSGEISHTPDGGLTWFPQNSGDTNWIAAIQFTDSLHGWAVGMAGMILRTRDGGSRWTRIPTPDDTFFHDVFFVDSLLGWVVGTKSDQGRSYPVVLQTKDGGITWRNQIIENSRSLQGVQFLSADVGFILAESYGQSFVYRTVDGGQNWDPSDSTGIAFTYAMHFIDADTGWVGGTTFQMDAGLVARTVDGGKHWAVGRVPETLGIQSLGFGDGRNGWAVGNDIRRTSDGGATWQREDAGGPGDQFIVYFNLDRENGWAAGFEGAFYRRPPMPNP